MVPRAKGGQCHPPRFERSRRVGRTVCALSLGRREQLLALAANLVIRPDMVVPDQPTALPCITDARRSTHHLFEEAAPQLVLVAQYLARCPLRCGATVRPRTPRRPRRGAGYRRLREGESMIALYRSRTASFIGCRPVAPIWCEVQGLPCRAPLEAVNAAFTKARAWLRKPGSS